jgi:hypothetical protein
MIRDRVGVRTHLFPGNFSRERELSDTQKKGVFIVMMC